MNRKLGVSKNVVASIFLVILICIASGIFFFKKLTPLKSSAATYNYSLAIADLRRFCPAVSSNTPVNAHPFIGPQKISQILNDNGSPVVKAEPDFPQNIYNYGKNADINPLVMLAFFKKESSLGKDTIAQKAHSVGYVICTSSSDKCISAAGHKFKVYASWSESAKAWFDLIHDSYMSPPYNLSTIESIMMKYSPYSDNNSGAFANTCQQINQAVSFYNKYKSPEEVKEPPASSTNTTVPPQVDTPAPNYVCGTKDTSYPSGTNCTYTYTRGDLSCTIKGFCKGGGSTLRFCQEDSVDCSSR